MRKIIKKEMYDNYCSENIYLFFSLYLAASLKESMNMSVDPCDDFYQWVDSFSCHAIVMYWTMMDYDAHFVKLYYARNSSIILQIYYFCVTQILLACFTFTRLCETSCHELMLFHRRVINSGVLLLLLLLLVYLFKCNLLSYYTFIIFAIYKIFFFLSSLDTCAADGRRSILFRIPAWRIPGSASAAIACPGKSEIC